VIDDTLHGCTETARARASRDFAFFANYVLDAQLSDACAAEIAKRPSVVLHALTLWFGISVTRPLAHRATETYHWLFPKAA
jgi:hypothetical protein